MPRNLSLSQAARLAGVSRGELQETIRKRGLPTFEGKIAVDQLLTAYPEIDMERDPVLERLKLIKDAATVKTREDDTWLPEPEVLMSRLRDFQRVLIHTRGELNQARKLLDDTTQRIDTALEADDRAIRQQMAGLREHLRRALDSAQAPPDHEAELFAKDALMHIVSASVKLLPSGHDFFVEGSDSLLEAALKSGLHLAYGCSSGNCGTCKVRVLSGEVRRIREHDYVLSEQERSDGVVLACSNTAVSDLMLEASEAQSAADLPQQEIRCSVRKVERVDAELVLVRVQTPRTQSLRFMAGQRVLLTTEEGHSRELALASCPCDARNLQFLVRCREGDPFAGQLLAADRDQTVLIDGPRGEFLLEEEAAEPAVFVAVGDGFAPIKSMIEHAIAIDKAERMRLYRIDEIQSGSLLGNLCRSWNDALDNFHYQRLEATATARETLAAILREYPNIDACQLYVAGPAHWVEAFASEALSKGALPSLLHQDAVDRPVETPTGEAR